MNEPDTTGQSAQSNAAPATAPSASGTSKRTLDYDRFGPYVRADESPLEFSIKAILMGALFGVLFGAANAYLGLEAGLTISTSIPVAVMTVAAFRGLRLFGVRGTILEANISQTTGSASSSVASGCIFTLPALFMWGFEPQLLQMTLLALCGGLLGVLIMVPLRRFLIEKEHGKLPYPEGTACAEVLVASEIGGTQARNVFLGLGVGALFKFVFGWAKVLPAKVKFAVPLIPKAELACKMSAALFGVGYILGPRIATVMVGGGLLSALVIIPVIAWWGAGLTEPFFPEIDKTITEMSAHDIWNRYVRYIGAGAVATGGLITLIRSIPTMLESFRIGVAQLRARLAGGESAVDRTALDMSLRTVGLGVLAVLLVMALVPQVFGNIDNSLFRAIAAVLVVIFAFFFVTVASRIVGLVGVTSNPTSGMTIASLLGTATIFLLLGWTDQIGKATALAVGCVVAIAASISGDTSQDLKTGFLLGATPRRQQVAELIGVLTSAVFVCLTLILLAGAYGFAGQAGVDPERALPAPQANLMKLVIDGVLDRQLPWGLVALGAGIAVAAELGRIPSLPFAVGVYLPVSTMVPVFLGGLLRWGIERRAGSDEDKASRKERGILLGSGLVGGEGLMGVLIAAVVGWQAWKISKGSIVVPPGAAKPPIPFEFGTGWIGDAFILNLMAAAVFVMLIYGFSRCCASRDR